MAAKTTNKANFDRSKAQQRQRSIAIPNPGFSPTPQGIQDFLSGEAMRRVGDLMNTPIGTPGGVVLPIPKLETTIGDTVNKVGRFFDPSFDSSFGMVPQADLAREVPAAPTPPPSPIDNIPPDLPLPVMPQSAAAPPQPAMPAMPVGQQPQMPSYGPIAQHRPGQDVGGSMPLPNFAGMPQEPQEDWERRMGFLAPPALPDPAAGVDPQDIWSEVENRRKAFVGRNPGGMELARKAGRMPALGPNVNTPMPRSNTINDVRAGLPEERRNELALQDQQHATDLARRQNNVVERAQNRMFQRQGLDPNTASMSAMLRNPNIQQGGNAEAMMFGLRPDLGQFMADQRNLEADRGLARETLNDPRRVYMDLGGFEGTGMTYPEFVQQWQQQSAVGQGQATGGNVPAENDPSLRQRAAQVPEEQRSVFFGQENARRGIYNSATAKYLEDVLNNHNFYPGLDYPQSEMDRAGKIELERELLTREGVPSEVIEQHLQERWRGLGKHRFDWWGSAYTPPE